MPAFRRISAYKRVIFTPFKMAPNSSFSTCACGSFHRKHRILLLRSSNFGLSSSNSFIKLTKHNLFQRPLMGYHQMKLTRSFHWSRKVNDVAVLEEARFRMGYPNWLNLFKNCFLGVSVNTGPEDMTNLLMSFVEHYFQDVDMEIECLIVLLLASISDKLSNHGLNPQPPHRRGLDPQLPHPHGHFTSFSGQDYDDGFTPVSNPGQISLLNALMMARIMVLVQQLATKAARQSDRTTSHTQRLDEDAGCNEGDTTKRDERAASCSKLDKVRILLSDLFVAAIFKEAASTGNPLILQYSFKAVNELIEGIFRNSYGGKELSSANRTREFFVENHSLKKLRAPFHFSSSRIILGITDIDKVGMRLASDGCTTTKINTYSTLLREHFVKNAENVEYPTDEEDHMEKHSESIIDHRRNRRTGNKNNANNRAEDLSRERQYSKTGVRHDEKPQSSSSSSSLRAADKMCENTRIASTDPDRLLSPFVAFMERREDPQTLYGWGWTTELGVVCQGCVALSGLPGDIQQAAFKFGSAIPRIRQMQWNGDLDSHKQMGYLSRLESYLGDFPDCANKRLLISLCETYVMRSDGQPPI